MNRRIGILEAGLSEWYVACVLGVSQSTVARMWEQLQTPGNVRDRDHGGCERVTSPYEDQFIVAQQFIMATALQKDLQNATGVRIST